jgi:hypothetical protein
MNDSTPTQLADVLNRIDDLNSLPRALLHHIGELGSRITHLEDVLRALLDDDNEKTRSDAERALC